MVKRHRTIIRVDGVLAAYVRVGNESVEATSTELKRLVLRSRNTSYDSQISTYKVEDFAFSKLWERYKKWTGNSFDEKDLISFGLANEQGYLTNAGALVADESLFDGQDYFVPGGMD